MSEQSCKATAQCMGKLTIPFDPILYKPKEID